MMKRLKSFKNCELRLLNSQKSLVGQKMCTDNQEIREKLLELESLLAIEKEENERLRKEVEFLRTHPSILQGLKGETIVCALTGGAATKFAEKYDVLLSNEVTLEVKFSKLNTPVKGAPTKRWNWSKPLGIFDKGKKYDFLVLLGEKDLRFPSQYLDESPYVCFLIPRTEIEVMMTEGKTIGGMLQINTNLQTARAEKSKLIKQHMVPMEDIEGILSEKIA